MNNLSKYLSVSPEVRQALAENRPVVALESTIISHGMPYPENEKFFDDCIDELKKNWDVFNTMTLEDIQSILNKL